MPCDCSESSVIRLVIESDAGAVSDALRGLFSGRPLRLLPEDDRGTAELVLAEALNNVVEHAYGSVSGKIEVTIRVITGALVCTICDRGRPMPGSALPAGRSPEEMDRENLPEGGFGWHIIRSLAQDLAYRRVGGRNELTFRLVTRES